MAPAAVVNRYLYEQDHDHSPPHEIVSQTSTKNGIERDASSLDNGVKPSTLAVRLENCTSNEASQIPHLHISENYEVKEAPLGTLRPVRVICIGAGASGVNLAYQVQQNLLKTELVIYEKNPAIGGTWYENRYPGCKCDIREYENILLAIRSYLIMRVASHNYQFSWEPNPNWNEMFSPQEEIRQYLDHCVEKYQLRKYIRLKHRVTGAVWDEGAKSWQVQIEDVENQLILEDRCDFLINAGGILNNWKWPNIQGLQNFQGRLIHSADWPSDWDYTESRVAVIGNGSTGIQLVPAMQRHVKQLIHFVRSPTWVTPGAASRYPSLIGGKIPEFFGEEQKEQFRNDPKGYLAFRSQVEKEINSKFRMLVSGSERAAAAMKSAHDSMMQLLGPDGAKYADKVIPEFPVGCRRITPGVGYLESFSKPNIHIVTDTIAMADSTGLVLSNGEHIKLDAIVCATGFDVSFTPRFPIIGRDSVSLTDVWSKNIPYAYLSMAVPKFPNYFSKLKGNP